MTINFDNVVLIYEVITYADEGLISCWNEMVHILMHYNNTYPIDDGSITPTLSLLFLDVTDRSNIIKLDWRFDCVSGNLREVNVSMLANDDECDIVYRPCVGVADTVTLSTFRL